MFKKSGYKTFSRDNNVESSELPSWMEAFADSLKEADINQTAVEVARKRDATSIADEINSIMNGRHTHSSVEDAIKYYQERTGLAEYINKIQAQKEQVKKVLASTEGALEEVEPESELEEESEEDEAKMHTAEAHNAGADSARIDFENKTRNHKKAYDAWIADSKAEGEFEDWMMSSSAFISFCVGYKFTYKELIDNISKPAEALEELEVSLEDEEPDEFKDEEEPRQIDSILFTKDEQKYIVQGYRDGIFGKPSLSRQEFIVANPEFKLSDEEEEVYNSFINARVAYDAGYKDATTDKLQGRFDNKYISREDLEKYYRPSKTAQVQSQDQTPGQAQVQQELPALFKKITEVKNFVDNTIKTKHGYIDIPAVQQDILAVYKSKGITQQDVDDPVLLAYINNIIVKEQKQSPETDQSKIGEGVGIEKTDTNEADSANADAFNFANKAQ
jgi:hypothetical protein